MPPQHLLCVSEIRLEKTKRRSISLDYKSLASQYISTAFIRATMVSKPRYISLGIPLKECTSKKIRYLVFDFFFFNIVHVDARISDHHRDISPIHREYYTAQKGGVRSVRNLSCLSAAVESFHAAGTINCVRALTLLLIVSETRFWLRARPRTGKKRCFPRGA